MDPLQHAENRGWLESLVRMIPGFRGYLAAEDRRESDAITRGMLAVKVDQCRANLNNYLQVLVNRGNLADLTHCEPIDTALITLGNRIRGEIRGYSGLFDFVKVDEAALDRVYQHDLGLLTGATALEAATAKLLADARDTTTTMQEIKQQVDALAARFAEREPILRSLSEAK